MVKIINSKKKNHTQSVHSKQILRLNLHFNRWLLINADELQVWFSIGQVSFNKQLKETIAISMLNQVLIPSFCKFFNDLDLLCFTVQPKPRFRELFPRLILRLRWQLLMYHRHITVIHFRHYSREVTTVICLVSFLHTF